MKIWLLVVIMLALLGGLIFGGIYVYKNFGTKQVPVSDSNSIGIFDITQNCTMQDTTKIRDCCKGICVKYCAGLGRNYVNNFLNQNNEALSCYCWC